MFAKLHAINQPNFDLYFFLTDNWSVDVMRVLLDHELLTLREAQQFLNVNRCAINEMIDTGKLQAIKIGSQFKIEGWRLKSLLPDFHAGNFNNDFLNDSTFIDASDSELSMISDWT
jgi:excisionase family DNA binding protein